MKLPGVLFVHLGPSIPGYAADAIRQAALFTPGPIYLLASEGSLKSFDIPGVIKVTCEDIGYSPLHEKFRRICPFNRDFRDGFWIHTTERFFYIDTMIQRLGLETVVHLENDVMLYAELAHLKPILARLYGGLAAPFDQDGRCVPCFVFVQGNAMQALCQFITDTLEANPDPTRNDMTLLAEARKILGPGRLDTLPILPSSYSAPLMNKLGTATEDPTLFSRHQAQLGFVFDAAAIGQYLGGADPRNFPPRRRGLLDPFRRRETRESEPSGSGFVNETSYFNPEVFTYGWRLDEKRRRVPFLRFAENEVPIANLHIHSKKLELFLSDIPPPRTRRGWRH